MSEFVTIMKNENQALNAEIGTLLKTVNRLSVIFLKNEKFVECFELSNIYDREN